jgi:hypothetical protein
MSALVRDGGQYLACVWLPLIEAGAVDPMQPQGLVKTTPIPTRDTDIHAKYSAPAKRCRP